jgi:hypothetical protein
MSQRTDPSNLIDFHPSSRPGERSRRRRRTEVLTEHEQAASEQLSRRLHDELRAVVALLPLSERGASAMSRLLSIDRATCQRIVGAISRPDPTLDTLVQLPGVEGLRQFVSALSPRFSDRAAQERIAAASAAIDRFDELLTELGGSQRRFKERLDVAKLVSNGADAPALDGPDAERARESLFRAAAGITGRWSAASLFLAIIRPLPNDPALTDCVRLHGLIGSRWRDPCIPLEIGRTATLRADGHGPLFATLADAPISGSTPGSFLTEFCSSPAPPITAREIGNRIVHVIDTPENIEQPIDVVVGSRTGVPDRHPATLQPAVGEVWSLQHLPARTLVFDTFLHRDIARRCIPSLEVHLWRPDVGGHAAARWSTRLPGGPRLEILGTGLGAAATPVYPRFRDLLESTFSRVGWDPDEFVGYRCEVLYPVWRAGYCMLFDFTGNEMPLPDDHAAATA